MTMTGWRNEQNKYDSRVVRVGKLNRSCMVSHIVTQPNPLPGTGNCYSLAAGHSVLALGGSSTDAVIAAIVVMDDN
jgi:hypothetical protein